MLAKIQQARLSRSNFVEQRVPVSVGGVDGELGALVAEGAGSLAPVVMLHGLGARGTDYARIAEALLPHVQRVVLPDYPGHGLSHAWSGPLNTRTLVTAMHAALPQLCPTPPVLYGNSMGGYGALWVASRSPERVRAVMVTSPAGGVLPDELRAEVLRRFQPVSHADALDLVDRSLTRFRGPARHLAAAAARWQLSRPQVRALVQSIAPDDDLRPEDLARLAMPVRVLWGTAERALAPEQREWFARHLPPHARLERPEGWGHAAFRERPDEVQRELLAFLEGAG